MDKRPYLTENAKKLLEDRYLLRDKNGGIKETPRQLFERVAKAVSWPEKTYKGGDYKYWHDKILETLLNLEVMPASPYLFNCRDPEVEKSHGLFSCFVLPIEDSMDKIYDCMKEAALVYQKAGGVGVDFSPLREKGSLVKTSNGISSGPLAFLKTFDHSAATVSQAGVRRSASMATLSVEHPDIEEFINIKSQNLSEINRLMKTVLTSSDKTLKAFAQKELDRLQNLTKFNLSIKITDDFMEAVEKDADWNLKSVVTGEIVKTIRARKLFRMICEHAWKSGDPGALFIDTINKGDSCSHLGRIECCNPCGEQDLHAYGCCNLAAIDINKCIVNGDVNKQKLQSLVQIAVRICENAIDVSSYPIPQIEEMAKKTRNIGIGIMGIADALISLGISYGSKEAQKFLEGVAYNMRTFAIDSSKYLAKQRGVFPAYEGSKWDNGETMEYNHIEIRNARLLTAQPTGSVAIISGASHGLEPLFSVFYQRRLQNGDIYTELNSRFKDAVEAEGISIDDVVCQLKKYGTIQAIDCLPQRIKDVFKCAMDISPEEHIRMQAAYQKYNDSSTSKTINMSEDATIHDVEEAYRLAYKLGCKGITVFRDGCKTGVLSIKTDEDTNNEELRDFLLNKYSRENMTAKEIADILDVSESQIFAKLKRFGIKKDEEKTVIQARERKLNTALKELIIANLLVGNSKINTVENQSSYRQVSDHLVYVKNIMRKFVDNGISCSEIMSIVTDKTYYYFDTVFNKDIYSLPVDNDIVDPLDGEEIETLLTRTFMRNLFLVGGVKTGKGGIRFCSKHGNYKNLKKIMKLLEKEIGVEFSYKDKDFGNNGIVYISKKFIGDFYNFIESGDNIEKINIIQSKTSCPQCGGVLSFCEGCKTCPGCGWSACSL